MKITLLGLGTVGQGVVDLLERNRVDIERKAGVPLELGYIVVRNPDKPRRIGPNARITTDAETALSDPGIDIVIELMGGQEPARRYMREALLHGKSVVTANKDVVATFGRELFAAMEEGNGDLYFEAAVGGGIPIIRALKESLAGNRIDTVLGIVNGTTNFILTRMAEEGDSFAEALAEAQRLGYAEADPSADVDGVDAARKLAILASIAFGARIGPDAVYTEGIRRLTPIDLEYARRLGCAIKLLAIGKRTAAGLELRVHPTLIPLTHPLAAVRNAYNAIHVTGDAIGDAMFYGLGAGGEPTASAVVGDLIQAARARGQGGKALGCTCYYAHDLLPMAAVESRFFLRLEVADRPGVLAQVAHHLGEEGVSIHSVFQRPTEAEQAEVVLVTHPAQEAALDRALKRITASPTVFAVASKLRMEGETETHGLGHH